MSGVYGTPITNETLEGLPEYDGKTIGVLDRASVALRWMNSEQKDEKALQYLRDEWKLCEGNCGVLCLLYNATGSPMECADHHRTYGNPGSTPFPIYIQNGQWGAFIVRASNSCLGGVVYRGLDQTLQYQDWMVAWKGKDAPDDGSQNVAYTEIREVDHFSKYWDYIDSILKEKTDHFIHKDEWNGCLSHVSIGDNSISTFRAVLTLKDANN